MQMTDDRDTRDAGDPGDPGPLVPEESPFGIGDQASANERAAGASTWPPSHITDERTPADAPDRGMFDVEPAPVDALEWARHGGGTSSGPHEDGER